MRSPKPFLVTTFSWICAIIFVLVACSNPETPPTSTLTQLETNTPLAVTSSPTKTIISSPASTFTATATPKPVFASTPIPQTGILISAENAENLTKLADWGYGQANFVTYSPDGKLLAIASSTGIYFYNSITLEHVGYILTDDKVNGVTFSPDSKSIAGTFERGAVQLWNIADGSLLQTFEHAAGRSSGNAIFSSDGALLVSGSGDRAVRLWQVSDGKLLRTFRGHIENYEGRDLASSISLSADDSLLASTDYYYGNVWIWRTSDGALVKKLEGNSVAFSPDGKILAVGIRDDNYQNPFVQLWQVSDWSLLSTLDEQKGEVSIMKFSPDGKMLITNDTWGMARLWTVADGTLIKTFQADDRDRFLSIAFSADGTTLASISRDSRIQVRGINNDNNVTSLFGFMNKVHRVVFSPDNLLVASGDDWSIQIWRKSDGTLLHNIATGEVNDLAFSPDGKLLASAVSLDGIQVWNVESGSLTTTLDNQETAYGVMFSPNGKFLAATILGGVKIWDVASQNLIGSFEMSLAEKLAFSPNSDILAVGGYQTVQLWQIDKMNLLHTLEDNSYSITDIEFSKDGAKLFVTGDLITVSWDVNSGKRLENLTLRGDAFSPDSNILTSFYLGAWNAGWQGGKVVLWQLPTGKEITSLKFDELVSDTEYSLDGRLVAFAFRDGTIQIWGIK
ncbi:MAG: WD40 repeat domain-containing protein [Anaerolineales bacterium]|nr:MAG: WD40 repeat domain-containing protein [Anaerolineales bacterium]